MLRLTGLLLLCLAFSACISRTLRGTVTAPECGDGYQIERAAVTVRNEKGEIIGSGTTTTSVDVDTRGLTATEIDRKRLEQFGVTRPAGCIVTFTVPVSSAKFYDLRIGTHPGPTYSENELERQKFRIVLTLK